MKYLLDTHTFLWFINDDESLSPTAKQLVEDPVNHIFLSVASIWEMAIKISIGKLEMPSPFTDFISKQLQNNTIEVLNISIAHAGIMVTLPFHHRDPFDRLLIAQSTFEDTPIIGRDAIFDEYNIQRIW
ncbi:MAG: type II toxin-antitoxin system VapC family toxin [Bacteroidota bacterium]